MADLSPGSHANLILDPDDVMRVTASGQATVEALYGAPAGTTSLNAQTQDFGPYGAPSKLRVTASSGRTSYEMLGALDAGAGSPVQAAGARGVGSVLSAVLGIGWTASGYQWVRVTNGVEANISGATGATYTQQSADVAAGVGVRVRVSGLSFTRDALATAAPVSAPPTPPTPPALSITASFPAGTVGTAYSGGVTASGGTAPYTYAMTAGTLPVGLSLNTSTGAVPGTPTTAATASGLVFRATDAAGTQASTATQSITVTSAVAGMTPYQALAAASSRTVDLNVMGDSNVYYNSYGVMKGLSRALYGRFGVYAHGVVAPTTPGGNAPSDYYSQGGTDNTFSASDTGGLMPTAFAAAQALWWSGDHSGTNLAAPRMRFGNQSIGANLGGVLINRDDPIGIANATRWHIGYCRAPSGALAGGSVTPTIRYSGASTATLAVLPAVSTTGGAAPEVAVYSYDLAAGARTADSDLVLRAAGGTAITAPFAYLWARVEKPAATTGVSVHSLFSASGKCAHDMREALVTHSTMAQLTAHFGELRRLQVARGYAPIVVNIINTMFNDTDAAKSLANAGGAAGSTGAFIFNLAAVKARVEEVWSTNAWPADELYWIYIPDHPGPNTGAELPAYATFRAALKASSLATAPRSAVFDAGDYTTQAAMLAAGWYATQVSDGSGGYVAPTSDAQMIHLAETTGANGAIVSRGYDGIANLFMGLVPSVFAMTTGALLLGGEMLALGSDLIGLI